MKIIDLEQNTPEWLEFRLGKIAGSRLGSIWSSRQYTKDDITKLLDARGVEYKKSATKATLEEVYLTQEDKEMLSIDSAKKLEYYQILADQVAVARDDEETDDGEHFYNMMDRGHRHEGEAADRFAEVFEKDLLVVGCCVSDEDERIMQSPDRLVAPKKQGGPITEAVEVKCLASAKHLMAYFERKIPEEYWTQKIQYFVVNPDLQKLYWVFYDPRIPMLPMFVLLVEREDLEHWPETMLKYQLRTLRELDALKVRLFEEADNILLRART